MTHDEAFLQDILENFDEDAPRLIYADWLEDHGQQPQAELIRIQCRLARLPSNDDGRAPLVKREAELLTRHQMEWAEPLLELRCLNWWFRRGILTWASFTAEDFLQNVAALVQRTPVRKVRLVKAEEATGNGDISLEEQLRALAASPHLGQLTGLNLNDCTIGEAGIRALVASPHLSRVAELTLSNNILGDGGAIALAQSPGLTDLLRLNLQSCGIGSEGALALSHSPSLSKLKVLDLGYNPIGDEGVQAIALSPCLLGLASLSLTGAGWSVTGIEALASSPHLKHWTVLELGGLNGDHLRALLASPRLGQRTALHFLHRPDWEDEEFFRPSGSSQPSDATPDSGRLVIYHRSNDVAVFGAILQSRLPSTLKSLAVRYASDGEARGEELGSWPPLAGLSNLDSSSSDISSHGIRAIVISPWADRLRRLDLRNTNIGPVVQTLIASPALANLETLLVDPRNLDLASLKALLATRRTALCHPALAADLARQDWPEPWRHHLQGPRFDHLGHVPVAEMQNLGDADVERLAALPLLSRLVSLDLGQTSVTLAGVRALAASPYLSQLRVLRLSFDSIGDAGAEVIASSPNLRGLTTLKLSFCDIGDAGVEALAASSHLGRLTTLKLWDGLIGDAGARALARSAALANLVALRLSDNRIGDQGAIALAESPFLRHLLYMSIRGNRIGPDGEQALARRFGGRVRGFAGEPLPDGL